MPSFRHTCWYVLVAIIGRITGAAGTCIASTVGTAGIAVGIPVTGAPRTSCSNLGEHDTTAQDFASILERWLYQDSAFTPTNLSLLPPPQSRRSHLPMIEPYIGSIAAWRLQGSAALALGRLLSRRVAGLTGPSPPPSPSDVLRRSCPEYRRQHSEPQVLLHPGVPGPAPPQPSLLPSLSPLLPLGLHRFRCLLSGVVSVGARG